MNNKSNLKFVYKFNPSKNYTAQYLVYEVSETAAYLAMNKKITLKWIDSNLPFYDSYYFSSKEKMNKFVVAYYNKERYGEKN